MANPCKENFLPFTKCVTPQTSRSSELNKCDCPEEYYCATICAEGSYEGASYVSWQHFPKSTSTRRSTCFDDSSKELLRQSISYDSEIKIKVEEESSIKENIPEQEPITYSISQLNALHYLEIRHIYQLLNFLIGHLVCNEPDDPISFLVALLNKCINFRDSVGEPPLLFKHSHITSLYGAYDPFERDYVTLDQYKEALYNLRIPSENGEEPVINEKGQVDVKHFKFEVEKKMIENLRKMLRIPKEWEENREYWIKKMKKKNLKKKKNQVSYEISPTNDKDKSCSSSHTNLIKRYGCECPPRVCGTPLEMEQLFFDYYTINAKQTSNTTIPC